MAVQLPDDNSGASPERETLTSETDPFVKLETAPKDPQPSRAPRRVFATKPTVNKRQASAATKKDLQAKIAMMLLPGAALWGNVDEYCGGAFAQVVPQLSEDLANILADNAEVVAWFADSDWLKWVKLVSTLQPVGMMIFRHHIAHTVGGEDGNPSNVSPIAGRNRQSFDAYRVPRQQASRVPSADEINQPS